MGEKIYYLEFIEKNGTPQSAINIPIEMDFFNFILNEIWSKQLPEIYAGNYEMKKPTQGAAVIAEIKKKIS